MLFFQQIKCVHCCLVGRAQHFVAVLDQAAVKVLVDHLDDVERDLAAFAQLLPAQHRYQDVLADAALAVALKQQALTLDPVVHVGEHVVGAGQDEPVAVTDVDLLKIVVVTDAAFLFTGLPDLWLTLLDARHHMVG